MKGDTKLKPELIEELTKITNDELLKNFYKKINCDIIIEFTNIENFINHSCAILILFIIGNLKRNIVAFKITRSMFLMNEAYNNEIEFSDHLTRVIFEESEIILDQKDMKTIQILSEVLFIDSPISRKIIEKMKLKGFKIYFTKTDERFVFDLKIELP